MNSSADKRILIVDDEADVIVSLITLFEDNGLSTSSAMDGGDGFAKAVAQRPDLIILGLGMQDESGVRMFRDLKENAVTSAIPVIIITDVSSDFQSFTRQLKQIQPQADHFEKPINKALLLAKTSEILQS